MRRDEHGSVRLQQAEAELIGAGEVQQLGDGKARRSKDVGGLDCSKAEASVSGQRRRGLAGMRDTAAGKHGFYW